MLIHGTYAASGGECDPERFNRNYWPILERRPGELAQPADPSEWIQGIISHEWYFDDSNPPWSIRRGPETVQRLNPILADWGCPPLPPMPRSGDLFWPRQVPRANPW